MEKVLTVKNLNKSFKGSLFEKSRKVLNDVSFSLSANKTIGFVGSNGSGKTTSIKCIFDFIRPDSGHILFFDQPIDNDVRRRIGYLPERPYLYEFLTGMEFLKLHWELCYGGNKKDFLEKAELALKKVNLFDARNRRMRTYSKGMLQRAGIAQAILTEPELLILDEPMSGLDPDGRAIVKDILRDEQKRGTTLFFSSHLLQDMEELCNDLVVIDQGEIFYEGTLKNFIEQHSSLENAFKHKKIQRGTLNL